MYYFDRKALWHPHGQKVVAKGDMRAFISNYGTIEGDIKILYSQALEKVLHSTRMNRPLLVIHGYSDRGQSFVPLANALQKKGVKVEDINIASWISLSNEVTVKDVGEALERALRDPGLNGRLADREFDAIVHSTGMLVIRSWLAGNPSVRVPLLKHLIGLAPATFGSPLAAQGRSVLGAIFKGNKDLGPDFLAAGDQILDALELGSRFTWDLAEEDLLGKTIYYGFDNKTPYVFVFCGTKPYAGIRKLVDKPGTDGTVRWAGVALDTVKFTFDLRRGPGAPSGAARLVSNTGGRARLPIPFWPVKDRTHGSIVSETPDEVVDLIVRALGVNDAKSFDDWCGRATSATAGALKELQDEGKVFQQFIVHARDQRGDPITDFHLDIEGLSNGKVCDAWGDDNLELHAYSTDKSYRCYHVCLSNLNKAGADTLRIQIIASSGSEWVAYHGVGSEVLPDVNGPVKEDGKWDAVINIPIVPKSGDPTVFAPFTTTLVEIILERDPLPLGNVTSDVLKWLPLS